MSYKDQEIVLDRQSLIELAENSDHGIGVHHGNGIVSSRRFKYKCVFTFNKSVAWDDGKILRKLDGPYPYIAELRIDPNFKIPNQTPFQHCRIRILPEIPF